MSNTNQNLHVRCLERALVELAVPYAKPPKADFCVQVQIGHQSYYFVANMLPLNNEVLVNISQDKGLTYDLLHEYIRMPHTLTFIDPQADEKYQPYVTHSTQQHILSEIEKTFPYPLVVKRNSGSQGENVFLCKDQSEVKQAISQVFFKDTPSYDHVLLAQEAIQIAKEFRVTVLGGHVQLVYVKDISQATFTGNLSPLHWDNAHAQLVLESDNSELWQRLSTFIAPIFEKLNLEYGGLDICLDTSGNLVLFEINSHPAYSHLLAAAGEEVLVDLYKKIIVFLKEKS